MSVCLCQSHRQTHTAGKKSIFTRAPQPAKTLPPPSVHNFEIQPSAYIAAPVWRPPRAWRINRVCRLHSARANSRTRTGKLSATREQRGRVPCTAENAQSRRELVSNGTDFGSVIACQRVRLCLARTRFYLRRVLRCHARKGVNEFQRRRAIIPHARQRQ